LAIAYLLSPFLRKHLFCVPFPPFATGRTMGIITSRLQMSPYSIFFSSFETFKKLLVFDFFLTPLPSIPIFAFLNNCCHDLSPSKDVWCILFSPSSFLSMLRDFLRADMRLSPLFPSLFPNYITCDAVLFGACPSQQATRLRHPGRG